MPDHDGMTPRLLLVEDDPISAGFLAAALEPMPAEVAVAATCAQALALPPAFDLWLIDANLPDGDGGDLLRRLREESPATPAVAHTADASPDTRARLLKAGFAEVLVKPLPAARLRGIVRDVLGSRVRDAAPAVSHADAGMAEDWDEAAALRALGGQREHVAQLRQLFLAELPAAHAACLAAFDRGDDAALRDALHRLRASCGFVGAARLGEAVAAWQADAALPARRDAFDAAVRRIAAPRVGATPNRSL